VGAQQLGQDGVGEAEANLVEKMGWMVSFFV
jgi:hypothetical protein